MLKRQTSGTVVCPSCNQTVDVTEKTCSHCGRKNPSMWGFAGALTSLGRDLGFIRIINWGCILLYIASLLVDISSIRNDNVWNLLSPSLESLFLFGASGSIPVFELGRWWTVFTAAWLHGSILHITFNLLWIREIAPSVAQAYGAARLVIIYTVSAIAGSLLSSAAAHYLVGVPKILQGANLTVGASGAFFGLLGALVSYGQLSGSSAVKQKATTYAVGMFLLGFIMPNVDNWGHLGGFLGGWAIARLKWLYNGKPEGQNHLWSAIACLALTLLSIFASVFHTLFILAG